MKTKTLREINKGLQLRDQLCSLIIIIKRSVFPKFIYKLNAIPIKIPEVNLKEIDKRFLEVIWKYKRLNIVKTILKRSLMLEDFNCLTSEI